MSQQFLRTREFDARVNLSIAALSSTAVIGIVMAAGLVFVLIRLNQLARAIAEELSS